MDFNLIWFILIVVLFSVFFMLEGFDYGVGILMPFLGKDDTERKMITATIGPVWDGNEVWMLTAGGAMFAAFPHVYATMFSAFYFALFLMLFALIIRVVAFEFRNKEKCCCWRCLWDGAIFIGSFLPALLWGVALTNVLAGMAINSAKIYTGTFFDLLNPLALLGGVVFLLVFISHGATFLMLRLKNTTLEQRVRKAGLKVSSLAVIALVVFLIAGYQSTPLLHKCLSSIAVLVAAVSFIGGHFMLCKGKIIQAFVGTAVAIVATTVAYFLAMFPAIMPSSMNPEWSLTIYNASSTPYTLSIMTIAAGCLVPVVLIYQIFSYYVFRKRITAESVQDEH